MLRTTILALALLAATSTHAQTRSSDSLGFTVASAEQRELEGRYDAMIDPDDLEAWMRELTDKPFYTGSPGGSGAASASRGRS